MFKLFMGNLPHSTTESGLKDFVTNAGFHVASTVVVRDKMTGQARGDSALLSWSRAKSVLGLPTGLTTNGWWP